MSELVRVARDGNAIIVKTDDGNYIRTAADGTSDRESATKITVLTAGGGWRRATSADRETFAEATIVASGKVFVDSDEPKPRIYRVPPTVQKSIQMALAEYAPLMADADREVASRLSTRTQVDRADIEWIDKFFATIEKALALHGGRRGQNWAKKVLSEEAVVASADEQHPAFSEEDVLFVAGTDEDKFDTLYMVDPADGSVYVWENSDFSALELKDSEIERGHLQEVDPETASRLAVMLDTGEATSLADLNPEEKILFELAESEMDFEYLSILADATGYTPVERSINATRQPRGAGGKFGGGSPIPIGTKTEAFAKARLEEDPPLVADPGALLAAYLGKAPEEPAEEEPTADAPIVAATTSFCSGVSSCSGVRGPCPNRARSGSELCSKHGGQPASVTAGAAPAAPLYLAIVDSVDKTAVLDVVSIVKDAAGNPTGWRREAGKWIADEKVVADIQGATPPPLVELSDEALLKNVLAQVDESDGQNPEPETTEEDVMQASAAELKDFPAKKRKGLAERGLALPDGSFPIESVPDLENAISAYGRAKDKTAARKHIRKRARALNRTDLIPDSWKELSADEPIALPDLFGPFGEILVASGVPGVADTPEDFRNVARLKRYWAHGPGTAKWLPGTPGDWTRLRRALSKYVPANISAGLATNIYKMHFGESNYAHDKRVGQ